MEERKPMDKLTAAGVIIVLLLIAGLLLSLSNIAKKERMYGIVTYDECAAAGFPIMESYPEQCATPDGRVFVNDKHSYASSTISAGR